MRINKLLRTNHNLNFVRY